jgi:hypothetical protein
MGCDYYIQTELVMEYVDIVGRISSIQTNLHLEKRYVYQTSHYDSHDDSDDDWETACKKYDAEIERRIAQNTYNKIIFENHEWIKESYRKKYEEQLKREFREINKFKKIYKKVTAWKRN